MYSQRAQPHAQHSPVHVSFCNAGRFFKDICVKRLYIVILAKVVQSSHAVLSLPCECCVHHVLTCPCWGQGEGITFSAIDGNGPGMETRSGHDSSWLCSGLLSLQGLEPSILGYKDISCDFCQHNALVFNTELPVAHFCKSNPKPALLSEQVLCIFCITCSHLQPTAIALCWRCTM